MTSQVAVVSETLAAGVVVHPVYIRFCGCRHVFLQWVLLQQPRCDVVHSLTPLLLGWLHPSKLAVQVVAMRESLLGGGVRVRVRISLLGGGRHSLIGTAASIVKPRNDDVVGDTLTPPLNGVDFILS